MNESFLSYLWKYRHFNQDIRTESGEQLTVFHPGNQNTDSGPDFFNARLRIGSTTWAGNVEIHLQASDWYRHGHHTDPAYDHVILHVVYEADRRVYHQNGEPVQTLVVRNQFPGWIYDRYLRMMMNEQWIPCMNQLHDVRDHDFSMWAPVLALERLEYKTTGIRQLLTSCGNDWDEAFYRHLAGCFGFKINSLPFELLAKSLSVKIIRQHCESLFRLEALLYGQAGLLDTEFSDEYPQELSREYRFLRAKFNLAPVSGSVWKYLRLRPSNFPTIRISQFASFLFKTQARFFNLLADGSLKGVSGMLELTASDYWNTHYVFDKQAVRKQKTMGDLCVKLLIINGLAPFLFFYGIEKNQSGICEGVLNFLEQTGGENNADIIRWKAAGLPVDNAMQTQALLHLKKFFCDKKRCLDCRIGRKLLVDNG